MQLATLLFGTKLFPENSLKYCRISLRKLNLIQPSVITTQIQQISMYARFYDLPLVHDQYQVGIFDS